MKRIGTKRGRIEEETEKKKKLGRRKGGKKWRCATREGNNERMGSGEGYTG